MSILRSENEYEGEVEIVHEGYYIIDDDPFERESELKKKRELANQQHNESQQKLRIKYKELQNTTIFKKYGYIKPICLSLALFFLGDFNFALSTMIVAACFCHNDILREVEHYKHMLTENEYYHIKDTWINPDKTNSDFNH